MKQLIDYSEEIYKCTKCGLCQAVCPVFEVTGKETVVSRGKFTLLNAVVTGKLKFSKNLSKSLELCLDCKACQEFCPSGIPAQEIISCAKYQSHKINGSGFLKKIINYSFNSRFNLTVLKLLLSVYKGTGLVKIADFIAHRFNINPVKLFNAFIKEDIRYRKMSSAKERSKLKLAYFPGCVNSYINPSVRNAVLMVLEKNGFHADIAKNFSCCGIPAKNIGNIDDFIKLAIRNLEIINDDIDYLITDCASCAYAWKVYEEYVEGELKEKAISISAKVIDINKFLVLHDVYLPDNMVLSESVTYHDPCHLKRFQDVYEEPRELLKGIYGKNYIEMEEADKCCGAAGTFCVTQHKISMDISANKADNILAANASTISTSCPSCKIGILQGLIAKNANLSVYHPVELLIKAYLK